MKILVRSVDTWQYHTHPSDQGQPQSKNDLR